MQLISMWARNRPPLLVAVLGVLAAALSACTFNAVPTAQPTPTLAETIPPSATLVSTATAVSVVQTPDANATPNPAATSARVTLLPAVLETATFTYTPGPPTNSPTVTPTPGPYEYIIQPDDTFYYFIQRSPFFYSNVSQSFIDEFLSLNPLLTSIDRLPPPGSTVLVPRQTPTSTPAGFDLTLTVNPALAPPTIGPTVEGLVTQVAVREGETILGVAASNETTIVVLATLNPDLAFFNCDFNNISGGPDCNVPLSVDQLINVPAPTPAPTQSPTFSGSETPTAIPTYRPPSLVYPADAFTISARPFQMQWVSVGVLAPQQAYFVQVEDTVTGTQYTAVTRSTSYDLPDTLVPSDGQSHLMRWRVSVAEPNEQSVYRIVSGDTPWQTFTWQSR